MISAAFMRQWGAPILAGLLAIGLGLGAWAFIDSINDDRERLRSENQTLRGTVDTLRDDAQDNAVEIATLNTRLEIERELYRDRIEGEEDRAEAADARTNRLAGEINALSDRLVQNDCPGSGRAIADGVQLDAQERDAARRSRERGIAAAQARSLSGSRGPDEADAEATSSADQ